MKRHRGVFLILGFLVLLNVFTWLAVFDLSQPRFLEVNFFDVGQGDAIFIQTPQKHQVLIDGGPSSIILEKLKQEMPFWDRSIDLIILTHPEHDHLAGLLDVLQRYKVDYILWTGVLRDTAEYKEWKNLIEKEKQEGAKIIIAKAGQRINLSRTFLDILFPFEDLEAQSIKNTNNTSVIAKLLFNDACFLFTGDAYKSVERKLVAEKLDFACDVLKVGHHGSKTSTSEEFIEQVLPEIAIISAGKDNYYGHPADETLETLEKYDIRILRTDEDGDIKIFSDGLKTSFRSAK